MNKKPQNPYFFCRRDCISGHRRRYPRLFCRLSLQGHPELSLHGQPHSPSHLLRSGPGFPVAAHPPGHFKISHRTHPDSRLSDRRNLSFLNAVAIILSLLFAALVIYILLAMVLPQVYESVVGLVQSIPRLFYDPPGAADGIFWPITRHSDSGHALLQLGSCVGGGVAPVRSAPQSGVRQQLFVLVPAGDRSRLTSMFSSVSAVFIALLMLAKDLLIAVIVSVYLLARKDIFSAQAKKDRVQCV